MKVLKFKSELKEITKIIKPEIQKVEDYLHNSIISRLPRIPKIVEYLLDAGGKRMRPIFTILVYRACGGNEDKYIINSSVAELLHTATLFHDDVIDEAHYRRGKLSVNKTFGNTLSVLVGDFLLASAFESVLKLKNDSIYKKLAQTSKIMAEGEILQYLNKFNADITIEDYMNIIYSKTSILFGWCSYSSAKLCELDDELTQELFQMGISFGTAFQIKDDLLDYIGSHKVGKDTLHDLEEGNITLPLIFAMRKDKQIKNLVQEYFNSNNKDEIKQKLLNKMHYLGIFELIEQEINNWKIKGLNVIEKLDDSVYKSALMKLFSFVSIRDY